MKINALLIAITALVCSFMSGAAEDVKLVPNANLSFEFSALGETLFAAGSADKKPARMSVILPENYAADKTFPLFVYIQGGNGGNGDGAAFARRSIGPRDYIAVNLPLFKDKLPATPPVPGKDVSKLITTDDGALLGRNYRVMLQKLFDSVPNIAADGSTIGGFSNGAHATGALLSAGDDFILKHFTNFVLLEGGGRFFTKLDAAKHSDELKHCRIIVLLADHGNEPAKKKNIDEIVAPFKKQAEELGLTITWITMAGYGHEQPPEFIKLIANWTRKEELPQVPPKASPEPKN